MNVCFCIPAYLNHHFGFFVSSLAYLNHLAYIGAYYHWFRVSFSLRGFGLAVVSLDVSALVMCRFVVLPRGCFAWWFLPRDSFLRGRSLVAVSLRGSALAVVLLSWFCPRSCLYP